MTQNQNNRAAEMLSARVLPSPPNVPALGNANGVPAAGQMPPSPAQPIAGQPQGMPVFTTPGPVPQTMPMQPPGGLPPGMTPPPGQPVITGLQQPQGGLPNGMAGLPTMPGMPPSPAQPPAFQQGAVQPPQNSLPPSGAPAPEGAAQAGQAAGGAPEKKTRTRKSKKAAEAAQPVQVPDPQVNFVPGHIPSVGAPGSQSPSQGIQAQVGGQVYHIPPGQGGQQPLPPQQLPPQVQQPQQAVHQQVPQQQVVAPPPGQSTLPASVAQVQPLVYLDPDEAGFVDAYEGGVAGDDLGYDHGGEEEQQVTVAAPTAAVAAGPVAMVATSSTPGIANRAVNEINYTRNFIAEFSIKGDEPTDEVGRVRALEAAIAAHVERVMRDYGFTAAIDRADYNQNDPVQNAVHILRFEPYLLDSMEVNGLNHMKCALAAHTISVKAMAGRMRNARDTAGPFYDDIVESRIIFGGYTNFKTVKEKKAAVLQNEPEVRRYREQYFLAVAMDHLFDGMAEVFEKTCDSLNRVIDNRMFEQSRTMGGPRSK